MKNYNEDNESSYIQYLDANNLYGLPMSQKLPVNCFKWVEDLSKLNDNLDKNLMKKFVKKFIENYDEENDEEYILEVDIEYLKDLHDLHSDLPFLPERMKVNKCNKRLCNMYDKNNYVIHIRALKQALNHGLVFKNSIE